MNNYRFSLFRKTSLKSGKQNHWYTKDLKLMGTVLKRIESEGPLMAKDFDSNTRKVSGWTSKPSKQALETLYMQGDLMISERKNFHKVYDLTERVLPEGINTSIPSDQEYARFLVLAYLKAQGMGKVSEITYLLKGVKTLVTQALTDLLDIGEIEKISVCGAEYFVGSEALMLLNKRLNRKQAKVLSPFDNLLIQRKRTHSIFNFDYLLECYVPEEKRQFGYFCLPILWDGLLVARANCKVDKQTSTLNVTHLYIEPSVTDKQIFLTALEEELLSFAHFNQCTCYKIHSVLSS